MVALDRSCETSRQVTTSRVGREHEAIDSDKDIYLLCGSGGRATAGDAYLTAHGYNKTHVIEGGIKAVIQAQGE